MIIEDKKAVIDERFLEFLDLWPEMNYNSYVDEKGPFSVGFSILFKNSTINRWPISSTKFRAFEIQDVSAILDGVIFLEGYFNCKAEFYSFKLTRNEFSLSINFRPIV